MPSASVATAAQRNHHSARDASLSIGVVAGAGLHLGERRDLDEVEVVEQADPGDAGEDVRPAEQELEPVAPAHA